jgi:predicted Fe-Mo cluster-binding NifX family protein
MKVAVPSASDAGLDAAVCPGLYGCTFFTIVDIGGSGGIEVMLSPGGGAAIFALAGRGVEAVLVREITEMERQSIAGIGMRVMDGATGSVRDAVAALLDKRLVERSDMNPCSN